MALTIPIVSEFDGKGVTKAIKEFQQLETKGQKANFALKKAAMGATVAFAGLAAGIGLATKAAIEDAQAQAQLATALRNTTGATQAQIASTEAFISKLTLATGVADDQLRPALAALVRGTKDIDAAQRALGLAMDISMATGMDLVTVSDALAKAYQGNMRGLRALSPEMMALIKEGASLDQVMQTLQATFGGAVAANAETAAGKMQILQNSLNEATESLGAAFLPVVEAILPKLQAFANWAGENTDTLVRLTYVIGGTTAAVIALNFAMNLNPVVALATGFIAIQTAIWKAGTAFRNAIGTTELMNWYFDGLKDRLQTLGKIAAPIAQGIANAFMKSADAIRGLLNGLIDAMNFVIRGINAIPGLPDIPEIPGLTAGSKATPGFGGISFGPPTTPAAIPTPQIGSIGAAPSGSTGGRAPAPAPAPAPIPFRESGVDPFLDNPFVRAREGGNLVVNVNGGLATSADIGAAVVDAIKQYTNVSGPADIAVR